MGGRVWAWDTSVVSGTAMSEVDVLAVRRFQCPPCRKGAAPVHGEWTMIFYTAQGDGEFCDRCHQFTTSGWFRVFSATHLGGVTRWR